MIVETLAVLGASGALSACWVALIKWVRADRAGERAKLELLESDSRHADHGLVDIRSNAFKPNELVATLCITCDVQLGPELWQKKLDDELAALDAPADHVDPARRKVSRAAVEKLGFRWSGKSKVPGSHNMLAHFVCTKSRNGKHKIRVIFEDNRALEAFMGYRGFGGLWDGELEHEKAFNAADHYVEVRPMIPSGPNLESPVDNWSADDYRRRGWSTEILDSNYDHSIGQYVLQLFHKAWPGRVSRLRFDTKADAGRWWGSCIPYDDFQAGRRKVKVGPGGIRSFTADGVGETFVGEAKRLTEKIAQLIGVPPDVVGRLTAAQADALVRAAQAGLSHERLWEQIPGWTAVDTARARQHLRASDDVEIYAFGQERPVRRFRGRP
jgi:hypothetical protein